MGINVYKITNNINGKVYIGQTKRDIRQRFLRHMCDGENEKLSTHFANAVKKYGRENFSYELLETVDDQRTADEREMYWIKYYNSCDVLYGYNMSHGGFRCGGNTYAGIKDMAPIKQKLSESKRGGKNPNSRCIVMNDLLTGVITKFDSMQEAANYLGLSSHMPVSRRCRNYTLQPLNGRYTFDYCDNEGVTTIENPVLPE